VTAALPQGSTFVSVEHSGTSAWTITGRLVALSGDGSEKTYFVKVSCAVYDMPSRGVLLP